MGRNRSRTTLRSKLGGELDDQDGVLRGEPYHHQKTDLEVHVARHVAEPDSEEGSEGAKRHAKQHSEGDRPAFVLRRQHQEHHGEAEHEDQGPLSTRGSLGKGLSTKTVTHSARNRWTRLGPP